MFAIPLTSIPLATYDPSQTWEYDAENISGFLNCSVEPIYVRLTVGWWQYRPLPEFLLAPGAQILDVKTGEPVRKVEVRLAKPGGTPAQFWGVLSTATDPIREFIPTNFAITQGGGFVPPIQVITQLQFQHNGALIDTEQAGDFEDTNSLQWNITPDVANSRVKIFGNTNLELDLVNVSGPITVSATTIGTAQAILTSDPIVISTALGTINLHLECYIPRVKNTTTGQSFDIVFVLTDTFDGSAVQIGEFQLPADSHMPFKFDRWFVPAAGTHTWAIKAFVSNNHVDCGGIDTPMQLHIGQFC